MNRREMGKRKEISGEVWRNGVGRGRRQVKKGRQNENGCSEHAPYVSWTQLPAFTNLQSITTSRNFSNCPLYCPHTCTHVSFTGERNSKMWWEKVFVDSQENCIWLPVPLAGHLTAPIFHFHTSKSRSWARRFLCPFHLWLILKSVLEKLLVQ